MRTDIVESMKEKRAKGGKRLTNIMKRRAIQEKWRKEAEEKAKKEAEATP